MIVEPLPYLITNRFPSSFEASRHLRDVVEPVAPSWRHPVAHGVNSRLVCEGLAEALPGEPAAIPVDWVGCVGARIQEQGHQTEVGREAVDRVEQGLRIGAQSLQLAGAKEIGRAENAQMQA